MTSKKRIAANRVNWQKGSGPRTKEGKAIASRNALRHGLGAMPNEATLRWIERISNAICGTDATLRERELATMIAESQVLIARVRAARRHAIERMRTASVTSQMPGYKFDAAKDRMMDAVRQNNFPQAVNILMRLSAKACRDHAAEVADEYLAKGSLRKGEISAEVS